MKLRTAVELISFAVLIFIDQITKAVLGSRDFFLGPVVIHLVKNYGLPFAVSTIGPVSFTITLLVMVMMVVYYFHERNNLQRVEHAGFLFIFAGAVSNIVDRIMLGYVRDFIDLNLGFVFNLADTLIIIGILMILFGSIPKSKPQAQP